MFIGGQDYDNHNAKGGEATWTKHEAAGVHGGMGILINFCVVLDKITLFLTEHSGKSRFAYL